MIAIGTGVAGIAGGFLGGKRMASGEAVSIATEVVELLQVQVATLTEKGEEKDREISDLGMRVNLLESLVTQRAEVEAVHADVLEVKEVVGKIANKVGA